MRKKKKGGLGRERERETETFDDEYVLRDLRADAPKDSAELLVFSAR